MVQAAMNLFGELVVAPNSLDDVRLAFADYNEAAGRYGWIAAKGLDQGRVQRIKARLEEDGGLAAWRRQIKRAAEMSFLSGDNDRGWRMDFDFFSRPTGWRAIAERKYANKKEKRIKRFVPSTPMTMVAIPDAIPSWWKEAAEKISTAQPDEWSAWLSRCRPVCDDPRTLAAPLRLVQERAANILAPWAPVIGSILVEHRP